MRDELTRALETFGIPMIMVTHDSDEVESFAETIVVYHNGNVENVHSARQLAESGVNLTEALRQEVARAYD